MLDLMNVPAILDPAERVLLRDTAQKAEELFGPALVIVNICVHRGGSCYCLRAGAPQARLFGVDISGWETMTQDTPKQREAFDMEFLVGDSRKVHQEFESPIHVIFVDGDHSREVVIADIENWVLPHVVEGGFALFHDAFYLSDSPHWSTHHQIGEVVDVLLDPGEWEEQEIVDSIRSFQRKCR